MIVVFRFAAVCLLASAGLSAAEDLIDHTVTVDYTVTVEGTAYEVWSEQEVVIQAQGSSNELTPRPLWVSSAANYTLKLEVIGFNAEANATVYEVLSDGSKTKVGGFLVTTTSTT